MLLGMLGAPPALMERMIQMMASRVRALRTGFFYSLACCALLLPLALSACGQTQGGPRGGTGSSGSIPSKVALLDNNGFQQDSVTIAANHGLDFVNLPSSPARAICLGQDGKCLSEGSGPDALKSGGILLQNDESQTVAFKTPGTYHLTTTPTPTHDLNVTVTK